MVITIQSRFPVSEPTVLTLVNSEHYAEAPRFSAGVSHIVFHHAHINDERDSPAAESAARSQNNYQNKSKEQERIILVHIAISMATWMIAMLS